MGKHCHIFIVGLGKNKGARVIDSRDLPKGAGNVKSPGLLFKIIYRNERN